MLPFGWIRRSRNALSAFCLAVLLPAGAVAGEFETKDTKANLRNGPSMVAPIIAELPPKSKVTVLDKKDKWYRVNYVGKVEGYVHRSLILKRNAPVAAPAPKRKAPKATDDTKGSEFVRQQATIAFARREWQEVVRLFDETPGVTRLEAGEGYMLGIAYREIGKFDQAEAALKRALGQPERPWDATSAEIYRQLLSIQQKRQRWVEVIETAKRITAHLPSLDWAVKAKAEACLRLRRPGEALAEYQAMLMKNPDDAEAFIGMGRARLDLNDIRGAEADFNTAIAKAPTNEAVYLGLAEMQLARKQLLEAEATLRRGIRMCPASTLLANRLTTLEKNRRNEEERAALIAKRDQLTARLSSGGVSSYKFIIVAKLKRKLYEIRLDNDEAAFLQTNRSVFGGPGYHEVPLINGGEIPVQLAAKSGGFKSRARLLKELSDPQIVQYQQTSMELREVETALKKNAEDRENLVQTL